MLSMTSVSQCWQLSSAAKFREALLVRNHTLTHSHTRIQNDRKIDITNTERCCHMAGVAKADEC
jgi:hypothetical protein